MTVLRHYYWQHMVAMLNLAQILLMHGAEPNVKNNDGETALHRSLACYWSPYDLHLCSLARLLLRHGANVNDNQRPYNFASSNVCTTWHRFFLSMELT
jgi:hypothetical protein